MLSRSTSPVHICLSCQLRILKRRNYPLFSSTAIKTESRLQHPKRARNFQSCQFSTTRLNGLKITHEFTPELETEAASRTESEPDNEQDNRDTPIRFVSGQEPGGSLHGGPTLKVRDNTQNEFFGRLHGRPGQEVREEARSLGIDTLGGPSDVIILRDARKDRYNPLKLAPPVLPPQEDIDFLAEIQAESGLVAHSEVDANIEDHKPVNPTIPLSERDFRRLRQTIEEGFTLQQLQRYVKAYQLKEARKEPKKEYMELRAEDPARPSLLYKTGWFPDKTKEGKSFVEDPLRGYSTVQHTTKQLQVLQVLRACWKLDVREVVASVGQLEMHINPPEFELLTNSSPSPLEPIISKLRNEDSERIDAFRSRGVLRITANQERALRIAEDIEKNILDRIEIIEIDYSHLMGLRKTKGAYQAKLNKLAMREVAKMTGTLILRSGRRLANIYYINGSQASKLTSPAEVAKRLLISYFAHFDKTPIRLGLQTPNSLHAEALVRCDDLECLPWYDRLRQWVRRTSAASRDPKNDVEIHSGNEAALIIHKKEDDVSRGDPTIVSAGNLNHVSPALLEAVTPKSRNEKNPPVRFWGTKYFTASSVIVGQVLHEQPNAMPIELVRDKGTLTTSDNQIFSTAVPNLLSLMELLNAGSGGPSPPVSESVVMHFEPSPLSTDGIKGSLNYKAFPPVEMRFGIEDVDSLTRSLFLKDVVAITQTHRSDVMIPHRPVDLRFDQRITSRILNWKPVEILEFLEASQLNLVAGIKTPARLNLPMDLHLCTDSRAWKPIKGSSDVMSVEYLFSGMDIKKKMQFDFNGWTLNYTDISSGKAGGKRREVRLRPRPTGSQARNEEDFIRTAFELVDAISGDRSASKMGEIQWCFPRVRRVAVDAEKDSEQYFIENIFARDN